MAIACLLKEEKPSHYAKRKHLSKNTVRVTLSRIRKKIRELAKDKDRLHYHVKTYQMKHKKR